MGKGNLEPIATFYPRSQITQNLGYFSRCKMLTLILMAFVGTLVQFEME